MLVCPHCQHRFSLTWSRYKDAGPGRYVCPECFSPSWLKLPLWLRTTEYMILIGGQLAAAVLGIAVAVVYHIGAAVLVAVGGVALWLALNIPLNIVLDGQYGRLEAPGIEPPPLPRDARWASRRDRPPPSKL